MYRTLKILIALPALVAFVILAIYTVFIYGTYYLCTGIKPLKDRFSYRNKGF